MKNKDRKLPLIFEDKGDEEYNLQLEECVKSSVKAFFYTTNKNLEEAETEELLTLIFETTINFLMLSLYQITKNLNDKAHANMITHVNNLLSREKD